MAPWWGHFSYQDKNMIFGKTKEQTHAEKQAKINAMIDGVLQYAWLPVRLANGTWAWLEDYYAYYHGGTNEDGSLFLWSSSPDSYRPYAANHLTKDPAHRNVTPYRV